MGKYYDNSIVPDRLKRNYDVYDRIKELNIEMGSFDEDVKSLKGAGISGLVFRWSYRPLSCRVRAFTRRLF